MTYTIMQVINLHICNKGWEHNDQNYYDRVSSNIYSMALEHCYWIYSTTVIIKDKIR